MKGVLEVPESVDDLSCSALEESCDHCWDLRVASSWVHTMFRMSWRESNMDAVVLAKAVGMLVSVGVGEGAKVRKPCTVVEMSSRCCERAADKSRATCVSGRKAVAMSCAEEAVEMACRAWVRKLETLSTNEVKSAVCAAKVASNVFIRAR